MTSGSAKQIVTRLGPREVDADRVFLFPRGLAGFENEHEFTLLPLVPPAPWLILQSMNSPQLGLLVANARRFLDSFPIRLGPAVRRLLKLSRPEVPAIFVTVTIPTGQPENAMFNLSGPIVINYRTRRVIQVPQYVEGAPSQARMFLPQHVNHAARLVKRCPRGARNAQKKERIRAFQWFLCGFLGVCRIPAFFCPLRQ